MGIDNYGLAQFASTQPNAMDTMQGGFQLKQMSDASNAANQQTQDLATLKDAYAANDPTTDEGQKAIMSSTSGKISPEMTNNLSNTFTAQNQKVAQMVQNYAKVDKMTFDKAKTSNTTLANAIEGVRQTADTIDKNIDAEVAAGKYSKADGATMKTQMKDSAYKSQVDSLLAQGLITSDQIKSMPQGYDANFINAQGTQSTLHAKALDNAEKIRHNITTETNKVKSDLEKQRHDVRQEGIEGQRNAIAGQRNSLEAEKFRGETETRTIMKDGKPTDIIFNKRTGKEIGVLGEAGKVASSAGGAMDRKAAITITDAAEGVVSAAKNLSNMPATTNTIFHLDKASGIMSASKEALKGEMTSDQAHEFNTHLLGLGLEMAQIKSPYAKPTQAMIEEFAKKYNVETGSSKYTSYMQLAQIRQDMEQSATAFTDTDKTKSGIPKDAQDKFNKAVIDIREAIPYTVKQLQEIKYKGSTRLSDAGEVKTMTQDTTSKEPVKSLDSIFGK